MSADNALSLQEYCFMSICQGIILDAVLSELTDSIGAATNTGQSWTLTGYFDRKQKAQTVRLVFFWNLMAKPAPRFWRKWTASVIQHEYSVKDSFLSLVIEP